MSTVVKKQLSNAQRTHLQKQLEYAIWDALSVLKDIDMARAAGFNEGRFSPVVYAGERPKTKAKWNAKDESGIRRAEYTKAGNQLDRKAKKVATALRAALLKAKKFGLMKEDFI